MFIDQAVDCGGKKMGVKKCLCVNRTNLWLRGVVLERRMRAGGGWGKE